VNQEEFKKNSRTETRRNKTCRLNPLEKFLEYLYCINRDLSINTTKTSKTNLKTDLRRIRFFDEIL
jgi:hypothetical protein